MKNIYIYYNPFTRETEVKIQDQLPQDNSWFRNLNGKRLQEWVDELPKMLKSETNDSEFHIWFRGMPLDYEDLRAVMEDPDEQIKTILEYLPPTNTDETDRQRKIEQIFAKIQSDDCPFPRLKTKRLVEAFTDAKEPIFNVFVVATMSSGKSTLINSLLGQKLMPSKQEACTAIITKIRDNDDMAGQPFKAKVYKNNVKEPDYYASLDLATMERLNADENVRQINAIGQIPFVDSSRISLVLIDTPGPNNKRNEAHREVQTTFLNDSAKPLVLYIMTGEFGNDSDYDLLVRIAESMKSAGKGKKGELRDRFLFVVNKLDGRKQEDGRIEDFMKSVESYLNDLGIDNPQLFPVAALPAMNIKRMLNKPEELDDDEYDTLESTIRRMNRSLHLEEQSTLPRSIKREINSQLEIARDGWQETGKRGNNNPDEALIHTGIPSLELAIRQYVEKYAYTAKIKNLVDTFMGEIEALGEEQKLEAGMLKSQEQEEEIKKQLGKIQDEISSAKNVKGRQGLVDAEVEKTKQESMNEVNNILYLIQNKITQKADKGRNYNIELSEIDPEIRDLERTAERLQNDFRDSMDILINKKLAQTCNGIVNSYLEKLKSLGMAVGDGNVIDPSKLMLGNIVPEEIGRDALRSIQIEERRKVGETWIENTSKKWWKPWTWGQEKGYWKAEYKDFKVIPLEKLVNTYFTPLEKALNDNCANVLKFIDEQSQAIGDYVKGTLKGLDDLLSEKINKLQSFKVDRENLEKQRAELQAKRDWLYNIKTEVNEILSI